MSWRTGDFNFDSVTSLSKSINVLFKECELLFYCSKQQNKLFYKYMSVWWENKTGGPNEKWKTIIFLNFK